jgi:ubiquitin carboxyl-terminal hydrolase 1
MDEGRVEEDVKGMQIVKVTRPSTKQAMVARVSLSLVLSYIISLNLSFQPPPVLVLHLNRSLHFGGQYGAAKNGCRVIFSEILDLTPYTTSGMLSTSPRLPISGGFKTSLLSQQLSDRRNDLTARTLYRLSAVVCHYGSHSFGHYVCYRRKPRSYKLSAECRWAPPSLQSPDEDSLAQLQSRRGTGKGWLRTSDDDVRECGIESVLQEGSGAFMLYYERIIVDQKPVLSRQTSPTNVTNGQAHHAERRSLDSEMTAHSVYEQEDDERTPRCSEETLKPPGTSKAYPRANGSISSLASTLVDEYSQEEALKGKGGLQGAVAVGLSSSSPSGNMWIGEPRLVRNVSLSRSGSVPPIVRSDSLPKPTEATAEAGLNGHTHAVSDDPAAPSAV